MLLLKLGLGGVCHPPDQHSYHHCHKWWSHNHFLPHSLHTKKGSKSDMTCNAFGKGSHDQQVSYSVKGHHTMDSAWQYGILRIELYLVIDLNREQWLGRNFLTIAKWLQEYHKTITQNAVYVYRDYVCLSLPGINALFRHYKMLAFLMEVVPSSS